MDRRSMLKTGGLGLIGLGLGGCVSSARSTGVGYTRPVRRLEPVRASWARVIRTTVGLRPYRPSGFVLRRERLRKGLGDQVHQVCGDGRMLPIGDRHFSAVCHADVMC